MRECIGMGPAVDWFNDDTNFAQAVGEALKVKAGLLPVAPRLHSGFWLANSQGYSRDRTVTDEIPGTRRDAGHLTWAHVTLLTAVPEQTFHLDLTACDVSGCAALTRLPDSIGHCKRLTTLDLSGCTALLAIPATIGGCTLLRSLSLQDCERLVSLPEALSQCASLTSLDLGGCGGRIETLADSTDPSFAGARTGLTNMPDLSMLSALVVVAESLPDRSRPWVESGFQACSLGMTAAEQQHYDEEQYNILYMQQMG